MTEWVLITMLCARLCAPQFATAYPTQEECTKHITKPAGAFNYPSHYCVPLARVKP
jgi:hypothetical protein